MLPSWKENKVGILDMDDLKGSIQFFQKLPN